MKQGQRREAMGGVAWGGIGGGSHPDGVCGEGNSDRARSVGQ
jgi:hypothetical protein